MPFTAEVLDAIAELEEPEVLATRPPKQPDQKPDEQGDPDADAEE